MSLPTTTRLHRLTTKLRSFRLGTINEQSREFIGHEEGGTTATTAVSETEVWKVWCEAAEAAETLGDAPLVESPDTRADDPHAKYLTITASNTPLTALESTLTRKLETSDIDPERDVDLGSWETVFRHQLFTSRFPTEPLQYPLFTQLCSLITYIYSLLSPADFPSRGWIRSPESGTARFDYQVLAFLHTSVLSFNCPGWEVKKPGVYDVTRARRFWDVLRHYHIQLFSTGADGTVEIGMRYLIRSDAPQVGAMDGRPSLQNDDEVILLRIFMQVSDVHPHSL